MNQRNSRTARTILHRRKSSVSTADTSAEPMSPRLRQASGEMSGAGASDTMNRLARKLPQAVISHERAVARASRVLYFATLCCSSLPAQHFSPLFRHSMSELINQIYAAFNPEPLKASKGEIPLYVDLDMIRGDSSISASLSDRILNSGAPLCLALTGPRGSGKSTELARLRAKLETKQGDRAGYFVVQVQVDEELDRNDVDFPEVLVVIMRQLALQIDQHLGVAVGRKPSSKFYKRLAAAFAKQVAMLGVPGAPVEITMEPLQVDLQAGIAELGSNLKYGTDARQKIRTAFNKAADVWLHDANDLIGEATSELKKMGYLGLVIMVDDLDKMIVREHESGKCLTTEFLFLNRAAHLKALQCHVIYTVPIELAHSHHEAAIRREYGGEIPIVPMAKLRTQPPAAQPWEAGIDLFREIIRNRLRSVNATESDIFASDAIRDELIRFTGGQPSELMALIRSAMSGSELPLSERAVHRAFNATKRSYDRFLRAEHWSILDAVRQTGRIPRTNESEPLLRQLLENRAILLYHDDMQWFGLNPAVEELQKPPGLASVSSSPEKKRSPCYVKSLQVTNIRTYGETVRLDFVHERQEPAMWTIILGDNSTGKTTLLHCLAALQFEGLGSSGAMEYTDRMTDAVRVGAAVGGYEISIEPIGELEPREEWVRWKLEPNGREYLNSTATLQPVVVFGYGVSRRIADGALSDERDSYPCLTLFDENAPLLNAEEWYLQAEFSAERNGGNGSVKRRDMVKKLLTEGLLPGVTDLRVKFRDNSSAYVEALTTDDWIPMRHLSSGYRSVISWMTDLASRLFEQYPDSPNPLAEPAIVLVDQIDLFLHPKWQRTLMQDLSDRFPKVQWIVTSHSPLVVQGMPGANLAVVRREDDVSIIDQTLPSIRGWRVDQMLSSELFDEQPVRDVDTERLLNERAAILSKSEITSADKDRLQQIKDALPELQFRTS